jgi:hypothetical protein
MIQPLSTQHPSRSNSNKKKEKKKTTQACAGITTPTSNPYHIPRPIQPQSPSIFNGPLKPHRVPNPLMSALTTDNTIATPILLHIKYTPHPRTPLRHPLPTFPPMSSPTQDADCRCRSSRTCIPHARVRGGGSRMRIRSRSR